MTWWNTKAEQIAALQRDNAELRDDLTESDKEVHRLIQENTVLTIRMRNALALTEMARRAISPLTMPYQHLHNIALILQGKEPL